MNPPPESDSDSASYHSDHNATPPKRGGVPPPAAAPVVMDGGADFSPVGSGADDDEDDDMPDVNVDELCPAAAFGSSTAPRPHAKASAFHRAHRTALGQRNGKRAGADSDSDSSSGSEDKELVAAAAAAQQQQQQPNSDQLPAAQASEGSPSSSATTAAQLLLQRNPPARRVVGPGEGRSGAPAAASKAVPTEGDEDGADAGNAAGAAGAVAGDDGQSTRSGSQTRGRLTATPTGPLPPLRRRSPSVPKLPAAPALATASSLAVSSLTTSGSMAPQPNAQDSPSAGSNNSSGTNSAIAASRPPPASAEDEDVSRVVRPTSSPPESQPALPPPDAQEDHLDFELDVDDLPMPAAIADEEGDNGDGTTGANKGELERRPPPSPPTLQAIQPSQHQQQQRRASPPEQLNSAAPTSAAFASRFLAANSAVSAYAAAAAAPAAPAPSHQPSAAAPSATATADATSADRPQAANNTTTNNNAAAAGGLPPQEDVPRVPPPAPVLWSSARKLGRDGDDVTATTTSQRNTNSNSNSQGQSGSLGTAGPSDAVVQPPAALKAVPVMRVAGGGGGAAASSPGTATTNRTATGGSDGGATSVGAAPDQETQRPQPSDIGGDSAAAGGYGGGGGDFDDEWDRANTVRQTELARQGDERPRPPALPISWDEALVAIRRDQPETWKKFVSKDMKRVSNKVKTTGFFAACWSCWHHDIAEGTELYDERDFLLALKQVELDHSNDIHRRILITLYHRLRKSPRGEPDPMTTGKVWQDHFGFQGTNPATDLRATGMLGLIQLLFLIDTVREFAAVVYSTATSRLQAFPLAIVSFNFSGVALDCLMERKLHDVAVTRFSAAMDEDPEGYAARLQRQGGSLVLARVLNEAYVGMLHKFLTIWTESPTRRIMEFQQYKVPVQKLALEKTSTVLSLYTAARLEYSKEAVQKRRQEAVKKQMEPFVDKGPQRFTDF